MLDGWVSGGGKDIGSTFVADGHSLPASNMPSDTSEPISTVTAFPCPVLIWGARQAAMAQ